MTKQVDWTKRKGITMPAEMADFVLEVAKTHGIPAYELVFRAVTAWAAFNKPNKNGDGGDGERN